MNAVFKLKCYGGPNSGKELGICGGTLVSIFEDENGKLHRYGINIEKRVLQYSPITMNEEIK
tara:strand:- start:4909 stop:5094 length:186 start_codon:yes stop_codon:yes gene_type:complete